MSLHGTSGYVLTTARCCLGSEILHLGKVLKKRGSKLRFSLSIADHHCQYYSAHDPFSSTSYVALTRRTNAQSSETIKINALSVINIIVTNKQ